MAITKGGSGRKPGLIFDWPGTVAPAGAIALPIAATNVSRTAYAKLFLAIGTVWGVGDGATTFGLPWCAADQALLQANGNVGTQTAGQVISHTHTLNGYTGNGFSTANGAAQTVPIATSNVSQATGGAANLPAGARVLKCIQYA